MSPWRPLALPIPIRRQPESPLVGNWRDTTPGVARGHAALLHRPPGPRHARDLAGVVSPLATPRTADPDTAVTGKGWTAQRGGVRVRCLGLQQLGDPGQCVGTIRPMCGYYRAVGGLVPAPAVLEGTAPETLGPRPPGPRYGDGGRTLCGSQA